MGFLRNLLLQPTGHTARMASPASLVSGGHPHTREPRCCLRAPCEMSQDPLATSSSPQSWLLSLSGTPVPPCCFKISTQTLFVDTPPSFPSPWFLLRSLPWPFFTAFLSPFCYLVSVCLYSFCPSSHSRGSSRFTAVYPVHLK